MLAKETRHLGGDPAPQLMTIRAGPVLPQAYIGRTHGRVPVFVDQDGGQFNYFLLGHLKYVKPAARPRVPRQGDTYIPAGRRLSVS